VIPEKSRMFQPCVVHSVIGTYINFLVNTENGGSAAKFLPSLGSDGSGV
jgi:hypothetical protein